MNKFYYGIFFTLVMIPLLVFPMTIHENPKLDQAERIVKIVDELYRADSSRSLIEMEIITPHWQRTLKMEIWSQGMDKTFIRILEPKKEQGIATLRIGTEMWNYLPKTDKVMKIPPSMMMSSWMGSDFTNDDLVKEYTFVESYHFEMTSVDNPEKGVLYIKCVPKEGLPIVWGYIIIAVTENDYIPLSQNYYDQKGTLMREMLFKEVKAFGNRRIPSVMELLPRTKKGQRTIVRYREAQFNIDLDKDTFSLRNLREKT